MTVYYGCFWKKNIMKSSAISYFLLAVIWGSLIITATFGIVKYFLSIAKLNWWSYEDHKQDCWMLCNFDGSWKICSTNKTSLEKQILRRTSIHFHYFWNGCLFIFGSIFHSNSYWAFINNHWSHRSCFWCCRSHNLNCTEENLQVGGKVEERNDGRKFNFINCGRMEKGTSIYNHIFKWCTFYWMIWGWIAFK